MFIKKLSDIVCVIAALALTPLNAQEPIPPSEEAPKEINQPGWLGVWVQPLPRELKAQLAHLTPSGEGLMVARVENNSPAQLAGIQRFDVVVSFAGQKLFSPEQLSSLVNNFNADTQVELEIIHQGQLKSLDTTLAVNKKRTLAKTQRRPKPYPPMPRYRQHTPPLPPFNALPDDSSAWDQFESVEVKTLADGRYHAKVSFKDNSAETRTFTFEGKKQEIIQQIQQLEELPDEKRRALLQALNLQPGQFSDPGQFGLTRDLFNAPFINPYRLNQHLFDLYPFNQPFFRDPYYTNRHYNDPWGGRGYPPPWQFHFYPDRPDWNQKP